MEMKEALGRAAIRLAREINADAVLVLTETGKMYEMLFGGGFIRPLIKRATGFKKKKLKIVAATPNVETYDRLLGRPGAEVIRLAVRSSSPLSQVQHAIWCGLRNRIFSPGELLVCLAGSATSSGTINTILVYRVSGTEATVAEMVESDPVLASVLDIACELGRGGYRGVPVGTAFLIGDEKKVMRHSKQLGINPFKGHRPINVTKRENKEIVKDYAFLDGAFVLDGSGKILAAGRFLTADAKVDIPSGLGTRHLAVAAMTAVTEAKGVTVSGTDGTVRVFKDGRIVAKIDPSSKILTEVLAE